MAELSACDIADGLVINGTPDGGELPYISQQSGDRSRTISGPAYTVEFAPKADPRPAVSGHYIDSVPEGAVLVLATTADCQLPYAPFTTVRQSLYGGLMSTRARFLGAAGTVVLGQVRDLAEHEELHYPVFSYGVGACPANKTAKVVAVNKRLQVSDTRVIDPGDIVYADVNGVVVVPQGEHAAVVRAAALRAKANEATAIDIAAGAAAKPAQDKYRKEYI